MYKVKTESGLFVLNKSGDSILLRGGADFSPKDFSIEPITLHRLERSGSIIRNPKPQTPPATLKDKKG